MPFADLPGHRIYFEDTGGDKPVIAFSHALLLDHSSFAPQIEMLRKNWRCISWDERGHGLTDQSPELAPFTHWDLARDLQALLAHLGVERAVLAGVSQGGFLSLRCALLFPALVRALILISTQAGPEDPEHLAANRALGELWLQHGLSDILMDNAERILFGENWPGAAFWREKWWRLALLPYGAQHFLQCLNTVGEREDITCRLPEINVPALVIHGDTDVAIPVTRAQTLAAELRGELMVVPGGPHSANLTHADRINPAIARFLAALPV